MKNYLNFDAMPTLVALAMVFSIPVLALPLVAVGQTYTNVSSSSSFSSSSGTSLSSIGCLNITYNLYVGARDVFTGGQVSQLQVFLRSQGTYNGPVTGYYGSLTAAGVARYQMAHGISATGYVGVLTRASIASVSCGNPVPPVPPSQFVPVVSSVNPTSGPVGTQVTLAGSNFQGARVKFDIGVVANVVSNNGTSITFTVPSYVGYSCPFSQPNCAVIAIAKQINPGTYNVSVENASGSSNAVTFTVTGGTTTNSPTVSFISPSSGAVGTQVTVTGSRFTSDNTVRFGSGVVPHAVSNNGTTLTFFVPQYFNPACYYANPPCQTFAAPPPVTPGTYSVAIENSNGVSNSVNFTVTGNNPTGTPVISSLNPASGSIGTTVTINGSGFNSSSRVKFDIGVVASVVSSNGMSMSFTIPSYIGYSCPYNQPNCVVPMLAKEIRPGAYNVSVENASGQSNTVTFVVTGGSSNSSPQISSINPVSGAVGTQVTLMGSGFASDSIVNFGTGATKGVVTGDGSMLSFSVPQYVNPSCYYSNPACLMYGPATSITPGNYNVSVTNSIGTSNTVYFTVTGGGTGGNQAPVLSGITGPSQVAVNQTGTWSVSANDPMNGQLTYNVTWGDEYYYGASAASPSYRQSQQTTTFTHAYAQPGTYTVRFTVTNSAGVSAQASMTVNVTNNWWGY